MITFWACAEHHGYSMRRIYREMLRRGENVSFSISPRPPNGTFVTSSGLRAWAYGKPHNRIIYINHGLSRHEIYSEYPKARFFKGVMFPGSWWKSQMRKPVMNSVVGWPKTDILFDPKLNLDWLRRKVNELTGLPEKGRVILYMSSWCHHNEKATLHRVLYAKALAEVAHELGFNILLKPHPGMLEEYFKLLAEKLKDERNIYILPLKWLKNSVALFPVVDALTSEHSGSLIEFLATDKPSIQLTPIRKHRKAVGGVIQADIKNMHRVFSSLRPHPEAEKWRRLMMGEVDGKASERAADFIQRCFNEPARKIHAKN